VISPGTGADICEAAATILGGRALLKIEEGEDMEENEAKDVEVVAGVFPDECETSA
jgi:hypothetical protein